MTATRVKALETFILIGLLALALIFLATGCASSTYKVTEYKKDGARVVTEISHNVLGKRSIENLDVNVKTGKIKLGSAKGDAGDLAEALLNMSKVAAKLAGT